MNAVGLGAKGALVYNATGDAGGGGASARSGPPSGWTAMPSQDITAHLSAAPFHNNNPSMIVQQAVDWYNSQPSVPTTLMVQDGQVYDQPSNQQSGGGGNSTQ